mmetsp:Transcript_32896/g.78783  ORF Transcript_32896/g.78783 Transcript_32896/m.78783 type:complete len:316 (+) Transcript_32896:216-1163(+)
MSAGKKLLQGVWKRFDAFLDIFVHRHVAPEVQPNQLSHCCGDAGHVLHHIEAFHGGASFGQLQVIARALNHALVEVAGVLAHGTTNHHTAVTLDALQNDIQGLPSHVVEEKIYTLRSQLIQLLGQGSLSIFVINGGIQLQGLRQELALLHAASDADDLSPAGFRQLRGDAADGTRGGAHHHGVAFAGRTQDLEDAHVGREPGGQAEEVQRGFRSVQGQFHEGMRAAHAAHRYGGIGLRTEASKDSLSHGFPRLASGGHDRAIANGGNHGANSYAHASFTVVSLLVHHGANKRIDGQHFHPHNELILGACIELHSL